MRSTKRFHLSSSAEVLIQKYDDDSVMVDVSRHGNLVFFSADNIGELHALADWIKANVPEPKPEWHSAKPWETWVFTIDGEEHARTLDEDRELRDPLYPNDNAWVHVTDPRITAALRIYPTEGN